MHDGSVGDTSWMGKSNALSKNYEHGVSVYPSFHLRVTDVVCLHRECVATASVSGAVLPFSSGASRAMPPVSAAKCFLLDKESMHRSFVGIVAMHVHWNRSRYRDEQQNVSCMHFIIRYQACWLDSWCVPRECFSSVGFSS